MYRCVITAPLVTRTGTYGTGRAPYKGCKEETAVEKTNYNFRNKEETAVEKTNYNFRRANFEAMRCGGSVGFHYSYPR